MNNIEYSEYLLLCEDINVEPMAESDPGWVADYHGIMDGLDDAELDEYIIEDVEDLPSDVQS